MERQIEELKKEIEGLKTTIEWLNYNNSALIVSLTSLIMEVKNISPEHASEIYMDSFKIIREETDKNGYEGLLAFAKQKLGK